MSFYYIHGETSNPCKGILQFHFLVQFYPKGNKIHSQGLHMDQISPVESLSAPTAEANCGYSTELVKDTKPKPNPKTLKINFMKKT